VVFALKLYHFVEAFGILSDNVMFAFNELLLESYIVTGCCKVFARWKVGCQQLQVCQWKSDSLWLLGVGCLWHKDVCAIHFVGTRYGNSTVALDLWVTVGRRVICEGRRETGLRFPWSSRLCGYIWCLKRRFFSLRFGHPNAFVGIQCRLEPFPCVFAWHHTLYFCILLKKLRTWGWLKHYFIVSANMAEWTLWTRKASWWQQHRKHKRCKWLLL